ncbi:cytochrome d ubiquinol oxidase subunit II [Micromonospora sp. WMMD1102]|uniref:cytochrome d ubiquinol oxidase subunit II n=1 Tax=Micromonospora sp. WMMD1102 TaxID=3016105 RepID=UPI0024151110|nr:cytochrome d ubiquinol oxidase subunit II [Micromonospora sp. WMMD1102]MDG4787054.1 cytochrome d ubiquinol oxidase subunit II [Micromonospora sp. WMMD1102]
MDLPTVWFLLIAVLFTGYFVLEGFDFGVGILLPVLGRDDRERRVLINTIGPVWDGNEVWLITAVGGLFAAFPAWYASLLSGFYLPFLLVLLALIFRGVAFEYRHKRPEPRWKARWDLAIFLGSLLPAALWGVVLGNLLRGVPLDARGDHTGGLLDLLHPYALLGGATTTALFVTHGAVFLALKTTGEIRVRAGRLAARAAGVTAAVTAAFLAASLTLRHTPAAVALAAAAGIALAGTLAATRVRREGWAFTGTAAAIGLTVATAFAALFPTVLPSTADPAGTLTIHNAASSPYTLTMMTWVAALFTPVVLGYQGWTYGVFRKRIGVGNIPR